MATIERKFLNHQEQMEMVQQIIETFESLLEAKEIEIPNPEKEQSDGPCNIYGTDYGFLEERIMNILIDYKLIDKEM